MTDIETLKALRERVREAGTDQHAGPDRELDAAIDVALFGGETVWKTANYTGEVYPASRRPSSAHLGGFANEHVPLVSSSVDAALALVTRLLQGWNIILDIQPPECLAQVFHPDWPTGGACHEGDIPSPALALIAAALSALIAEAEARAGGPTRAV